MHAHDAPPARRQHFEIAKGLRELDGAEAVLLARDGQILRVVAGNQEEHAGVRSAFVPLARRVQVARAKSDGGRDLFSIANEPANGIERVDVRLIHLDERQHREVVALTQLIQ